MNSFLEKVKCTVSVVKNTRYKQHHQSQIRHNHNNIWQPAIVKHDS